MNIEEILPQIESPENMKRYTIERMNSLLKGDFEAFFGENLVLLGKYKELVGEDLFYLRFGFEKLKDNFKGELAHKYWLRRN